MRDKHTSSYAKHLKWWTLAVVAAGTFMSAFDGSVVNIALPVIQKQTNSALASAAWVVVIYLLTTSSTLLVFGRLGDMYDRRRFYIAGLGFFTIGSILCGLSPGIHWLIGFRVLQALGASSLMALGPALLTSAFPGSERGRALGLQATVTYLGLATGPTLGGILTQHLGWRWIFFINVPIGALVIPAAFHALQRDSSKHGEKFDPIGAITLAIALVSLLFALTEGSRLGWGSSPVITAFAVSAAAFMTFVLAEKKNKDALVDLSIFSSWVFSASTVAALLSYMVSASVTLLMPYYLEMARGFSVQTAGYILVSTPVVMALLAGWSGALSDRIGQRVPATVGMAITVAGVLLLRTLTPMSTWWSIVLHFALIGVGIGLFTSPNNSAIMGSAPKNRQGVAGAILAASRNIGFVLGAAFAVALYSPRLHTFSLHLPGSLAITRATQDATTIIALMASVGVFISAFRGRVGHREQVTGNS